VQKILINGLECFGHHGVFEKERIKGQTFIFDLIVEVDIDAAGKTDNLDQSVDYAAICELVQTVCVEKTFNLLEALAEYICTKILLMSDRIENVIITVRKPKAPVDFTVDSLGIVWERKRSE